MGFLYRQLLPDIFQITDALGVSMTLLVGENKALLADTGYGLEDVGAFVRQLTQKSVTVLLTHGHHDHALGMRWFNEVEIFPEDFEVLKTYTGEKYRRKVLESAKAAGIEVEQESYLTAPIPAVQPLHAGTMDLGGLSCQAILCPGHTPGSAVIYVPERKLLLTGDNWNPCTWLFFPEALPVKEYLSNMKKLLEIPFENVICSHRGSLYHREDLEAFLYGLTDEALKNARETDTGAAYHVITKEAAPCPEQVLVFDSRKSELIFC
ncbi:MAG: MBL fold metallo-hydrolase [Blautia sp.]|nr:MBL fold metallo-hydrolase [Blautia sp.]